MTETETSLTETSQHHPTMLLQACDSDLQQLRQRVGTDRTAGTYTRQCRQRNMVAAYIHEVLKTDDIAFVALNASFISDYATYLSNQCRLRDGTVWLACQWLKGVAGRACRRGWLPVNPFADFHVGRNIRPRDYLSESELHQLMTARIADGRQSFFRDVFIFSALTGLSFADIDRLCTADLRCIDGQQWVLSRRKKTHTPYQVRLLPQAEAIIARYGTGRERIFGPITYRTLAKHIPLIIRACGISRHITFHSARHTFAILCLNAGLPIESISRMLGHTNISTTQIYARITLGKLNRDLDRLQFFFEEKINK